MNSYLSWFASENPEQIQKIYNLIQHKSVTNFYLFHNTIATSSEILHFLNSNSTTSNYYKNIEISIKSEFPDVTFLSVNITTFILLSYISQNNVSKIIVNIPKNITTSITEYDIVSNFKDIRFFYPNLITEIYICDKVDEKYDDMFKYTTNIFCRNTEIYDYYVNMKSSLLTSLETTYNYFPKLFYIKFSDLGLQDSNDSNDSNSKLITRKYKNGITFGTFDLFHYGHDNILKRCMQFCEYLCLGLSSDELNNKKGKNSVDRYEKRKKIIEEADEKYADFIFKEERLEYKNDYVTHMGADILMMGDDWLGKFDWVSCNVVYMERTPNISTTMLKEQIANSK
jgi:glycerol-3-phosphate cytidylyltransferase